MSNVKQDALLYKIHNGNYILTTHDKEKKRWRKPI